MFTKSKITTTGDVFRDEKSLAFDGGDEYVETSFVPNYTNITVSTWVKVLNNSATKPICAARDSANDGFLFYMSGSETPTIKLNGTTSSGNAVTTNVWVHLLFTWDGSTIKFYQDGILVDSDSKSGTMAITTAMEIGGESSNSYSYYGNISEVAIYNSALTANQVKTIYNGREPYNHKEGVASGNLQAWYRMGDGIIDRIGKNAHTNTGAIADMSNYTLGTDVLGGKGDFSDASYWTITSGQSIVESNVGKFLGNGSYGVIQKSSVLTANKIYLAKVTCSANAGAPVHFNFGDPFPQIIPDNETGEFSICFVAGNTNVILYATTYNEAVTIDNLTIQEVGGNAGAMINMAVDDFEGDTP